MSTIIESKHVEIARGSADVFEYLMDFNNIKTLLPQDKISDWTATTDSCSFKIQNAAVIPLVKSGNTPHSKINIVSGEQAPFPFTLEVNLIEKAANLTEGYLYFEGDINMFLKMMVVKPLTNLFDYMADRLQAEMAN